MSLSEQWSEKSGVLMARIKTGLFGQNNERLDFLMDSFYKLTPPQRSALLVGGAALFASFILGAVGLYFAQARALERELSNSVAAIQELRRYKQDFATEDKRTGDLLGLIRKKSSVNFKSLFEKIAQAKNTPMRDVSVKPQSTDAVNPITEKFSDTTIDVEFAKISIPRLLGFVAEVEKSDNLVKLQDVKITGQYGNKLFFDAKIVFHGYQSK